MHHRISGLFHRRQKDGKHCHEADDASCLPFYEEVGDRSSQKPHRLTRCDGLRGLRSAEDFHSDRFCTNNATDSSLESAFSAFNMASPLPSISKLGSPLPSPPRSPVVASQATSLWPLPSPRQFPKKCDDHEMRSNGFPVDHWDTGNALPIEGEAYKSSHFLSSTENFHRHPPPPGLPVPSTLKTGAKPFGSSGAGLPAYPITKQVDRSSNERISSPLQSPKGSRIPKEPWNWTSDRVMYEDRTAADDNLTQTYHLQNGRVSKNIGYPPLDSQAIALSSVPSPPLSPSSNRALSPGGWIKGHLLGTGAFGKVYKGIHSGTGEFCAIKEVEFEQSDHRSREAAEQLKKEIVSLSSLQHPNIVQYKGSELVGDSLYIYLELISGGSLYKLYQEFKKLEEPVIRRYTRQILLGLAYLHGRKFVHRDIKCANILVDQDGTIKLADFGVSKYIKEQGAPFSLKGSPHWMAPEVIMATNTGYEYALDIWSLGCTVIEMVMGRPPWCELEAAAAMFKITKVGAPPIPHTLSAEGRSFVKLCLQKRPADRPTAAVLLEHPFVKIHNETYHNVGHAFELEHIEGHPSSSVSSGLVVYPSLSAPSSPRSSYKPANDTLYTQGLKMHVRGSGHGGNVESRNHTYDSYPAQERLTKPKAGIPPTGRRRSHEFSHAQPRPSLSAPVSPKSPRMHGNLYPSLSGDVLPGYPTPFSESRGI